MKVSLKISKQFLHRIFFVLTIASLFLLPAKGFSQEEQEIQDLNPSGASSSQGQIQETTVPVVGGNPWENSAGSVIGTPSADNGTTDAAGSANSSASRPASAQRPIGSTIDGRDPPGNPDIPFSKSMNLVFLITGLVFAFWVAKKKMSAKPNELPQNN